MRDLALNCYYAIYLGAVEAIEKAVEEVAKFDADDWFVIAISDANFSRYQITAAELKKAMNKDPKVSHELAADKSVITVRLAGKDRVNMYR